MSINTDQEGEESEPQQTWSDSFTKAKEAIRFLGSIISITPPSYSSSETPAQFLLNNPDLASQVRNLLIQPDSGAGENTLCRWLYDTFQSSQPDLQLVVLRFLPIITGVYLSRVALHTPLAGFEAVLLALYAYETTSRNGQSVTVSIPDLSHSSIYHETKQTPRNSATELNIAVISPSLEPYGAVRSTKRARIVAVALELYFSKISQMPVGSKIEFCEFCKMWAGLNGDVYKDDHEAAACNEISEEKKNGEEKKGRINLPWELLQPVLRILGHCLMGINIKNNENKKLFEAACDACRCLYARALHDINPKAILATGSLLKLAKMASNPKDDDFVDHTEIVETNVITL